MEYTETSTFGPYTEGDHPDNVIDLRVSDLDYLTDDPQVRSARFTGKRPATQSECDEKNQDLEALICTPESCYMNTYEVRRQA